MGRSIFVQLRHTGTRRSIVFRTSRSNQINAGDQHTSLTTASFEALFSEIYIRLSSRLVAFSLMIENDKLQIFRTRQFFAAIKKNLVYWPNFFV